MEACGFTDPRVVSIDGSAFDSTQYALLKEAVDNTFFRAIIPSIRHILSHPANRYRGVSTENAAANIVSALCETQQVVWICSPGLKDPFKLSALERRQRKYLK
jgi:hypothetical protein